MKITELLEKDKDRLLTEIGSAGKAEKAIAILEKETDKLLVVHDRLGGPVHKFEVVAERTPEVAARRKNRAGDKTRVIEKRHFLKT